jgi:hypothetical protein
VVTAAADAVAAALVPVPHFLGRAVRPLRPPFDVYIRMTGQLQTWAMFANPPRVDEYLRVRYYVRQKEGRLWMATQLLSPSHREDQVRLVQSFRDSYLDKAFAVALAEFRAHRQPALVRSNTRPEELPDDLAPIARYYTRVFAQRLRLPADRVVRTEVWAGSAANTPPGRQPDEQFLRLRRDVLRGYYEGPVERGLNVTTYPPYHGLEREADIDWLLEYFEES